MPIREIVGKPSLEPSEDARLEAVDTVVRGEGKQIISTIIEDLDRLLEACNGETQSNNWRLSLRASEARGICSEFLVNLEALYTILNMKPVNRSYREQFTLNYKALFPGHENHRHFRVDVLEACLEQYQSIYVNGERYDFPESVLEPGRCLLAAWIDVMSELQAMKGNSGVCSEENVSGLVGFLKTLDQCWAEFEKVYITELIVIEERARRFITQLCKQDKLMRETEKSKEKTKTREYRIQRKDIIEQINVLNAVANSKTKGRSDLKESVLYEAEEFVNRHRTNEDDTGYFIAEDVIESYLKIRKYLRDVSDCLERVDPHLCHNENLVQNLAFWEESWELSQQYIQNTHLLDTFQAFSKYIRSLGGSHTIMDRHSFNQGFIKYSESSGTLLASDSGDSISGEWYKNVAVDGPLPELLGQIRDHDCETFITVPRLFLLWVLDVMYQHTNQRATNASSEKRIQSLLIVLKNFLPSEYSLSLSEKHKQDKQSLSSLLARFTEAVEAIRSELKKEKDEGISHIKLAKFIVTNGDITVITPHEDISNVCKEKTQYLLKQLEEWSMAMQRSSAKEWNTFMKVILRSVTEIEELSVGEKIRARFAGGGYYSSSRRSRENVYNWGVNNSPVKQTRNENETVQQMGSDFNQATQPRPNFRP